MTPRAAVATSQPLATEAGVATLRAGGTAADAAVAVAAALQVTKPCVTGLGGDAFFLYYESETKTVHGYNGSGRSPAALTRESVRHVEIDGNLPEFHPLTVTVPGAADAWTALHKRFGTLQLGDVLEPAVKLAADGFPVSEMAASWWTAGAERQLSLHRHGSELMIDGRGPRPGEIFRNPGLVRVFGALTRNGRDGVYDGWVAERIVEAVSEAGGILAMEDLRGHTGEWTKPIAINLGGYRILECPPNGQGLAALLALGIYRELESSGEEPLHHLLIESMRLAFADAARHVADPAHASIPVDELLSTEYLRQRARLIRTDRRLPIAHAGTDYPCPAPAGSDTVYFAAIDPLGNACSFINSNFRGFGTGIVPEGCGFSIQNRGRGFSLEAGHPNEIAPGKRPYHTIIPGMITAASGELDTVFGIMGGFMQPQAHLQVVRAMIEDGADPQAALDMPRFFIEEGDPQGKVLVEDSMPTSVLDSLRERGHPVETVSGAKRSVFGLGQIISRCEDAIWSGSDPRGDGQAAGF